MASFYVRDLVKGWASSLAVPFHNTVNEDQDPADPVWTTIDWGYADNSPETFCADVETGSFALVVFGQPGQGDADLLQTAESLISNLMGKRDNSGKLSLLKAAPAMDFWQHNLYGIEFQVSYEYRP